MAAFSCSGPLVPIAPILRTATTTLASPLPRCCSCSMLDGSLLLLGSAGADRNHVTLHASCLKQQPASASRPHGLLPDSAPSSPLTNHCNSQRTNRCHSQRVGLRNSASALSHERWPRSDTSRCARLRLQQFRHRSRIAPVCGAWTAVADSGLWCLGITPSWTVSRLRSIKPA